MKRKILYLDMDGVIADFDKAIDSFCPGIHAADPETRARKVNEICADNPDIFHDLSPIDGAIASTNRLFELFEVYFLSTAMWHVPDSFTGKRIWIEKHFGEMAKKRLILTPRKDLNIGDFLVDDRTKNGAGEFSGVHIHFGTEKFPDWKATLAFLEKVA